MPSRVAPRLGSVDLNNASIDYILENNGRSPFGERGLKYYIKSLEVRQWRRSPFGERGLKCDNLGDLPPRNVAPRLGSVD